MNLYSVNKYSISISSEFISHFTKKHSSLGYMYAAYLQVKYVIHEILIITQFPFNNFSLIIESIHASHSRLGVSLCSYSDVGR